MTDEQIDFDGDDFSGVFEVYQAVDGLYRWRLKARNGEIIAESGQGYQTKQSMLSGIDLVRSFAPAATIQRQENWNPDQ